MSANGALLPVAEQLISSGLSVIPIGSLADKWPARALLPLGTDDKATWLPFQERQASPEELRAWFGPAAGLAIVGGKISGGLTILDFDKRDGVSLFEPFAAQVEALAPGLMERFPIIRTQSDGRHLYFRCEECGVPEKLARTKNRESWIETRANGGYCVAPRSAGYQTISGSLTQIPTIAPEERALLFAVARSQDAAPPLPERTTDTLPGAAYNARASLDDMARLLQESGWREVGRRGDSTRLFRRPGKAHGISATLGQAGHKSLYVFSSSAHPFEAQKGYSPFAVYALVRHQGDFKAAAAALSKEGYGDKPERPPVATSVHPGSQPAPPNEDPPLVQLLTGAAIWAESEVNDLVAGILPRGGLGQLFGVSGCGKTHIGLSLAAHVAMGRPWHGHVCLKGQVVYVCAEGPRGFGRRYKATCAHYNDGSPIEGFYAIKHPLYPTRRDMLDALYAQMDAAGCPRPVLLVLDTQAANFIGDENNTADMGTFANVLTELRQRTSAALLVFHHSGLGDKERGRGSQVLRNAADMEAMISRESPDGPITVECKKSRDGRFFDPMSFMLQDIEGTNSCVAISTANAAPVVKFTTNERAVLDCLAPILGGMSFSELQRAAELSPNPLNKAIGALYNRGYIRAEGDKGQRDRRYFATAAAHTAITSTHFGSDSEAGEAGKISLTSTSTPTKWVEGGSDSAHRGAGSKPTSPDSAGYGPNGDKEF